MATRKDTITSKAIEKLESEPDGVRHSILLETIQEELPNINLNTIRGAVWDLDLRKS